MNNNSPNTDLRAALGILARDSRNGAAHIQAGVAYSKEKMWEKSIFHLKKALAGDKKNPLILEKLCDVLVNARLGAQARKYARKLVDLRKRDASAYYTMARVWESLGNLPKALHWINQALAIEPNHERMLNEKANYLSTSGEMEQALEIHQQILQINPLSPHSWWPLAQLQKFDAEKAEKAMAQVKAAIGASHNKDDLRGLNFAAGKILQDVSDYKGAFEHFEKANLLHDRQITADRIVAANINFQETYTPEFYQNRPELDNLPPAPVFILGQTRSGTTLTESLCASHSKISAGGELAHLTDFNNRLELFSVHEKIHQGKIHNLTRDKISDMVKDFDMKTRHLQEPGTRLTDKMPQNFLSIGLISVLFPNARIIHCRRHPLDNCLSIFSNPMLDYHKEYKSRLEVLGQYYQNYVQIMRHWKKVCPIPIHDVFYEDLVSNTQSVAGDMISYLDLDWEDGVMDRTGSLKVVKTLSVWQVRQPIFQSSKGKWHQYEEQLAPLKEMLAPEIAEYEAELAALDAGNKAEG